MSTLAYSYSEPYKLPAGILALVVHVAFFALLYFGVNWHTEQPQGMVVDIWNNLPKVAATPAMVPPPPPPKPVETPKPVEMPRPVTPPKADIALPEKKKPKLPEPKRVEEVKKPPVQLKQTLPKISEAEMAQQAAQAAQLAAIGKVVDDYKLRIIAKVRRNIVMPPDVPDSAQAEFDVILLPGGSVLSASLSRPSGNAAYDDAVERAIMKAQPLPLPPDVTMFNRFRELHLIFRPKE